MAAFIVAAIASWRNAAAFVVYPAVVARVHISRLQPPVYSSASPMDDDEDEEVEVEVEPGKMRVSEIKAELKMRMVSFDDCFDKESLALRLKHVRATGKADPSILNDFNKRKLEENFSGEKVEVKDDYIDAAVASDGTLPGGLDPKTLKKLMANPEVMTLLQSTKMQEAMQLMMIGGQEDLEKAMNDDPEMLEVIQKLNEVLEGSLQ